MINHITHLTWGWITIWREFVVNPVHMSSHNSIRVYISTFVMSYIIYLWTIYGIYILLSVNVQSFELYLLTHPFEIHITLIGCRLRGLGDGASSLVLFLQYCSDNGLGFPPESMVFGQFKDQKEVVNPQSSKPSVRCNLILIYSFWAVASVFVAEVNLLLITSLWVVSLVFAAEINLLLITSLQVVALAFSTNINLLTHVMGFHFESWIHSSTFISIYVIQYLTIGFP